MDEDLSLASAKFRAAVVRILDIPEGKYRPDLTMDDLAQWDSVRHFELILEIEEAFGKRFAMDVIPGLDSLPKIWAAITAHQVSNGGEDPLA